MLLMEERFTENCLWYLFLRAKYVFSIPFMSMNGVNKSQRDASNGRTFNWKLSVVSFPPREICIFSIPFMSMNGVNKGQIFLSFTNFNDLFLV